MKFGLLLILVFVLEDVCFGEIPHFDPRAEEVETEVILKLSSENQKHKRSVEETPDDITADITVGDVVVDLHLRKNTEITDDVPVLLQRNGNIAQYRFPQKETVAVYQDVEHDASFLVWDKRQDPSDGLNNFHMFGTFMFHDENYLIQPPHLTEHSRHTIAKMGNSSLPTSMDYIVPDYDEMILTRQAKRRNPNNGTSRQKRQITAYEVEILIVTDYAVYTFWYDKTNGTAEERHTSAINTIKQFYSFVMNSLNLRYETVNGLGFTITCLFSGIYIAETSSDAPFVESNLYDVARTQIVGRTVLDHFRTWANENLTRVFDYDHAMLFTRYDLISTDSGQVSTSLLGLAYLSGLCRNNKYSINEDHFAARLVTTAAHELGHNLGARHDEVGNNCSADDGFIMAASSSTSFSNSSANIRQWVFSICSLQYFQAFIDELDTHGENCMTSRSLSYNASALADFAGDIAGQIYGPDYQCEQGIGAGSYLYREYYDEDYSTICQVLACSIIANDGYHRPQLTWEGTTCGNGKLCEAGVCINSSRAPTGLTVECLFGDVPYNIPRETQTCVEFLGDDANSSYCYQSFYRESCCATCNTHRTNNPDCEYGDKSQSCAGLSLRGCYANEAVCCKSCPERASSNPDCKYGDRASGCNADSCPSYSEQTRTELCCGTCADPTTTSTTPSTTTTTSTTTTSTTSTTSTTPTTSTSTTTTPSSTTTSKTTSTTTTSTPTTTSTTTTPTTTSTTTTPTTTSTTTTTPTTTSTTTTPTTASTTTTPTTASTTTTPTTTSTTTTPTTTSTTTTTPTTTSTTTTPKTTSTTTTPTTTSTTTTPKTTTTTTTPKTTTTTTTPTTTTTTTTPTTTTTTTTPTTTSTTTTPKTTTTTTTPKTTTTTTTPMTTSTTPTTTSTTPTTTSNTTTPTTTSTTITPSTTTSTTTTATTSTSTTSTTTTLTATTSISSSMTSTTPLTAARVVRVTIVFPVVVTGVNFDDSTSSGYVALQQIIIVQLSFLYSQALGVRFLGIRITRIRPGPVIVDYEVDVVDEPEVTSNLTDANVKLVTGESTVTIANQTVSAASLEVNNVTVTNETVSSSVCELFTASGGCQSGYSCVVVNGKAACEPDKTSSGIALVLAIAIGLAVLLILVLIFIGLVLRAARLKKLERKKESKLTSNSHRSRSSDSKKELVFPPVSPYGGISSWNDGAYVTSYPNLYKNSRSSSYQNSYDHHHSKHVHRKYDSDYKYSSDKHYTNKRRETLQNYAHNNRAADFDSVMADTYVRSPYDYA